VILLALVDWAEAAVVFVARTFCMIWVCAPVKIVKDTNVHPKAKIKRTNIDLLFFMIYKKCDRLNIFFVSTIEK
jgi:hypothetical protein